MPRTARCLGVSTVLAASVIAGIAFGPAAIATPAATTAAALSTDATTEVAHPFQVLTPLPYSTVKAPALSPVLDNARVTFSGTGASDARIEIRDGNRLVGSGRVDDTGYWTVDAALDYASYSAIEVRQVRGAEVQTTTVRALDIERTDAGDRALEVLNPTSHSTVESSSTGTGTVTFSGAGQADAEIEILAGGELVGRGTVDGRGRWSVDTNLPVETHRVVYVSQASNESVQTVAVVDLTVSDPSQVVAPLVVTSPRPHTTITAPAGNEPGYPNAKVTFTGTGQPDATIEVLRANGKTGGTTTVDQDGNWTADVDAAWVAYPWFDVIQTSNTDTQNTRIAWVTIEKD